MAPAGASRVSAAFGFAWRVIVWQTGALTFTFIADGVVAVIVLAAVGICCVVWEGGGKSGG